MSDAKQFDAVVIGSGLGGLTAGALLARQGYGVLLLERNFSLGGAASVYKVGGLTVEASLHQTSDPRNPRDPKRRILDELGLLDEIEWISTGPLYTARGGPLGDPFALPAGFGAAASALAERFPAHGKAIERFLGASSIRSRTALWNLSGESAPIGKSASRLAACAPAAADWTASLADVLAREFGSDEALKCALGANFLYYGDDPRRMWFIAYALAQGSNIGCGGAYIKGRLAAIEPQARQGDHQGGRLRAARPLGERDRDRRRWQAHRPAPCEPQDRRGRGARRDASDPRRLRSEHRRRSSARPGARGLRRHIRRAPAVHLAVLRALRIERGADRRRPHRLFVHSAAGPDDRLRSI